MFTRRDKFFIASTCSRKHSSPCRISFVIRSRQTLRWPLSNCSTRTAQVSTSSPAVNWSEFSRVNKVAAQRVVFSGVGKTAAEIDLALRSGILIFNVESAGELELLAERASKLRKRARIALRVNPDVFAETHPYISTGLREHKFGIDIRQARAVYKAATKHKYLDPCGVSVHIGSQIRSTDPFGAAAERVAQLIRDLRADGLPITSVDVGGGLGIEYHADHSFNPEEKIQQYATALLKALCPIENLQLLLEPGRFIVAQAGALLTRVLYVKKNGKKTFVVTDAAMNDLIRPALYQAHHDIVPVSRRKGARKKTVDVVGPVCETGDFFARDRELPETEARRSSRDPRCRSLRPFAQLKLQFASASRRGSGRRQNRSSDPSPRNYG